MRRLRKKSKLYFPTAALSASGVRVEADCFLSACRASSPALCPFYHNPPLLSIAPGIFLSTRLANMFSERGCILPQRRAQLLQRPLFQAGYFPPRLM